MKDEKGLDDLVAEISAKQVEMNTLQQQLANQLGANNIEWPEDSQEGNSDRKVYRALSERLSTFYPSLEMAKLVSVQGREQFQETSNLSKKIITDNVLGP